MKLFLKTELAVLSYGGVGACNLCWFGPTTGDHMWPYKQMPTDFCESVKKTFSMSGTGKVEYFMKNRCSIA